jgi:hypothetical protein
LSTLRAGFFGGSNQRTAHGPARPVVLRDGERIGDIVLRLWPTGVVTGTVVDEYGDPAAGLPVKLFQRSLLNGQRRLEERQTTRTDDRGRYRFAWIRPGQYVVAVLQHPESFLNSVVPVVALDPSALAGFTAAVTLDASPTPLDIPMRIVPMTFAPQGTELATAAVITVHPGDARTADILVARTQTFRVAGVVSGAEPAPRTLRVRLISPDFPGQSVGLPLAQGAPGNRFDFASVPAGRYVLRAVAVPPAGSRNYEPAPRSPTWWAERQITVDRDQIGLSLVVRQGARITGRIEFDGAAPPTPSDQVAIYVSAIGDQHDYSVNAPTGIEADATFRTVGLPPGRYVLRLAGGAAPWRLGSVYLRGRDVTDLPIEVAADDVDGVVIGLSDRPLASLMGEVRTVTGALDPDAVVVLFPVDRRLWANPVIGPRFQSTSVTSRGFYAIPAVRHSEYFVLAGNDDLVVDWLDPEVLARLAVRATRVTIGDGERKSLDLTRRNR